MSGRPEIRAVVFDWAGTVVDFGSRAPMGAFVETFAEFGVAIDIDEARRPMGLAKRPHVAALLAQPRIAAAWAAAQGSAPDEAAIDRVYAAFVPRNIAVAAAHATLVPGVAELAAALRARGIRIGSTTGYTRSIMQRILPRAAEQGFTPELVVCAEETPAGRPGPAMLWANLIALDVWPAWRAVKVDDTPVGIAEGVNGGAWSVGVSVSGNEFGRSEVEVAEMPTTEIDARRMAAEHTLRAAGAHEIVDTVAGLPVALARIESRIRAGERPTAG